MVADSHSARVFRRIRSLNAVSVKLKLQRQGQKWPCLPHFFQAVIFTLLNPHRSRIRSDIREDFAEIVPSVFVAAFDC